MINLSDKYNFEKKPLPKSILQVGSVLVFLGIIIFIISYITNSHRAFFNNILLITFLGSIAVGSIFLIALEYISGAVWSVSFRRIVEASGSTVIILPLLILPLIFNISHIFHWAHLDPVNPDKILLNKQPYLNVSFFIIRTVIVLLLWLIFYFLFINNSLKQDKTANQNLTRVNIRISAIFLPVFAISLTVFAVDWIMSLEPHWFSTIFGIYYFSGTVLAALGMATFFIILLYEKRYFPDYISSDHFYSLGALLFAFTNFWAYIAFSQFLLIWYADLPEETFWFISRWKDGWTYFSLGLIIIRFIIPYFALLSQPSKTSTKRLKFISLWIVFAHLFDLYWLIMPELKEGLIFNFYELSAPLTGIGIVMIAFYLFLNNKSIIPVGDPKLKRNIDFHL